MSININKNSIIYPHFVTYGAGKKEEINSFPGQYRFSVDKLVEDLKETEKLGINKILLFGVPDLKDKYGSGAYSKDNIVSKAVRKIKSNFPGITVITDVCLCSYTTHGHCGILKRAQEHKSTLACRLRKPGQARHKFEIDNKATLEVLAKIAVAHAEAGADYVAPSAMAKKQVLAIRNALDKNGYKKTKIMGYSAKFASSFYGPFRSAADSAPKFGDRKSYQLNYNDAEYALREIKDDIDEGADIVMVKPALAYLDIIYRAKQKFSAPIAAYNVSGEYALVKSARAQEHPGLPIAKARAGKAQEEKNMILEILAAIKRAGAEYIITYHAKEIAKWLK